MQVSARNTFNGLIQKIEDGAINSQVTLVLPGGDALVAVVTRDSVRSLGLAPGKPAVALVKAPWVMLASPGCGLKFSARNQLTGRVSNVDKGAVNSEVTLTLPGGSPVCAVVTNDAVRELDLQPGKEAVAIIKASHVILGVSA
jgi:molybdate transport system regulatory protein